MKKDAYYFPHFSNARHDRKIKRAMKDLGCEAYAIYFMLLEVLRDQQGFKYPLQDLDLLQDEFGTSLAKIQAVVKGYDLFQIDEDHNFFSMKFNLYLQPYIEKSERARTAANVRWEQLKQIECKSNANAYANAEQMQCVSNASKVKESKVKESKEEKDIPSFQDGFDAFINFATDYFKTSGEAFDYNRLKLEAEEFASYWFTAKEGCKTQWEKKKRSDLIGTTRNRFADRVGKIKDYSIKKPETEKQLDKSDPVKYINDFVISNLDKWKTYPKKKDWMQEIVNEAESNKFLFRKAYYSNKEYYGEITDPMQFKNELFEKLKEIENAG